jgi:hypothetical protein
VANVRFARQPRTFHNRSILLELSRALFPPNFRLSLWGEFIRSRWRCATIERKGSQKIPTYNNAFFSYRRRAA